MTYFFAAFLEGAFFAAAFLATAFLAAGFLATVFLAGAFFVAGFLAAALAGFAATVSSTISAAGAFDLIDLMPLLTPVLSL